MWAVLKNRDYFWLWMGNTVSLVGDRVREWAMIYWVYEKSGNSPFVLSLSLFAAMLPNLLLAPVAGVWVDRWDRRRTMLISDLVRGCLSLLLIAAVATGQYWYALAVTFLASCAAQFFSPSRSAMVRRTVGPENLLAANSLAQTTDSVLSLAGPALGTAIFTFLGAQVAFIVDAASYFLSAACIAMVRTSGLVEATAKRPGFAGELSAGLRFCWQSRPLRAIILSASVLYLGAGAINSLGIYLTERVLGLDETTFGYTSTLMTAASLLTAVTVGSTARKSRRAPLFVALGMGVAAVGIALLAGALNIGFLVGSNVLIGVANVLMGLGAGTTMQSVVPDQMLGRVSAVFNIPTTSAMLLSALSGGALALLVNPRWILGFAALTTGLAALYAYIGLRNVALDAGGEAAPATAGD